MALGKIHLCRVPEKSTQQRRILPSAMPLCQVPKKALGKDVFCRVPKNGTRQNTSLPSAEKKHSANPSLPSAEKNTRQTRLCRVPDKIHSAKLPALGKVPVSGSVILRGETTSNMNHRGK